MGKNKKLRSRQWFDNPKDPGNTSIYLERIMNYGYTPEELTSGKPIIGIAQTGSDISPCNRVHLKLAERIRQEPNVNHVTTVSDTIKRLNKAMNSDDEAYYDIPENREIITHPEQRFPVNQPETLTAMINEILNSGDGNDFRNLHPHPNSGN